MSRSRLLGTLTPVKRSIPARALGLLALVGAVLCIVRVSQSEGVEDPEIHGRRVSFWFREISRSTAVADIEGPGTVTEPRAWVATAAIKSAGTNAMPWIVAQAVKPTTRWERWLQPLRFHPWLRDRVSWPLSAEDRQTAARGLLRRSQVPAAGLLELVEHRLRSREVGERLLAIRCLGTVGAGREFAVSRLRPFLSSTNAGELFGAVQAVARLGNEASLVATELVAMLDASKPVDAALATALGNCGSAAVPALGVLEARWARGIEGMERLRLAVVLLRIQPAHAEARRFMEEGLGSSGSGDTMFRDLGNLLWQEGIRDALFVPWLVRGFEERGQRRWPAGGYTALAVLSKTAPVEVSRILRVGIQGAATPGEAVAAAVYWLELQPDSREAADVLVSAMGGDDPAAVAAVSRVWLADPLPPEATRAIQRFQTDSRVTADLRHQLTQVQRALEIRSNGRREGWVP